MAVKTDATRLTGTILKHTLNRGTKRIANSGYGPFSIVRHVGRKSGRTYETPIIVQPVEGGFMVELTYGPNVDWYRNVVASGECVIRYRAVDYEVTSTRPVNWAVGIAAFSPVQRALLTVLRRSHFVLFVCAEAPAGAETALRAE
jgi:deazaflavin-dependent oxidoreductase (nitroreductase family)